MIRLAHLSDIHITTSPLGWQRKDWFNKRFTSWLNFRYLGRGQHFRYAEEVLTILMQDVKQQGVEHMLFSGDATALGFEAELCRAAELLEVKQRPGLAVPGNHDYITRGVARSGLFERVFAPWQTGQRPAGIDPQDVEETYPFAQRIGPAWVIGMNSAVGNIFSWDATGIVGRPQLERLQRLLAELSSGPRVLVTHYPVCLADARQRENIAHRLRDLNDVVRVAAAGGVSIWLHGHRHYPYILPTCDLAPFPVICVGSATQTHCWSYNEYTFHEHELKASRRTFDPRQKCFREIMSFTIPFLPRNL